MVMHFLRTTIFLCSVCALGLQIYLLVGFLCKGDKERCRIGVKELPLFFILGSGAYTFYEMFFSLSGIKSSPVHFWLLFAGLSLMNITLYFKEVSKKLLKTMSETSDYGDFKKITEIIPTRTNRCNLNLIAVIKRALFILRLFQSSLKKRGLGYKAVIQYSGPITFAFWIIVALLVLNLILAMAFPQFDIDMLGHILIKAKLLTTDTYKDSVLIHDPLFANLHNRYPPFVPMVFNLMFLFGADTIAYYQIVNYFILLLLGITVYGYLKERIPVWQAILCFFIFISTREYLSSQYIIDSTDILLSLVFLLVILWWMEFYKRKDTFSLVILAVLIGLVTLIKNEAIPFTIIVTLAFIVSIRKMLLQYLLICFIIALPWFLYRQTLPLSSSPNAELLICSANILVSIRNLKYAFGLCSKILLQSWNLFFIIWIPSLLLLLKSRYRKEALFFSSIAAIMLLLYIIIISVHVDRAVIYDKGFLRVLSHLYPMVFILVALAVNTLSHRNFNK